MGTSIFGAEAGAYAQFTLSALSGLKKHCLIFPDVGLPLVCSRKEDGEWQKEMR
jgi:hypothetical protein